MYTAGTLASLFPSGNHLLPFPDLVIQHICIDSRKASWQPNAIFLALQGARIDGHRYILDAFNHGVRTFLIKDQTELQGLPEANYILVPDVLRAFHQLAIYHRSHFTGKVIAITGSNGKTWVKEWLYMLMYKDLNVYRSPGSYNSQVGVPLSVWNIPLDADYAIIEAGVSTIGEMASLAAIIQPEILVFTHLGDAHDEGFHGDGELKLKEKFILANNTSTIVYPGDEKSVEEFINNSFPNKNLLAWSLSGNGNLNAKTYPENDFTVIQLQDTNPRLEIKIPFSGVVPIANAMTCIATLQALHISVEDRLQAFEELQPIDMRLKAEDGIQGCVLINDSYSLDLDSLQFALESLDIAGPTQRKTLVLSDHAHGRAQLYPDIAKMIRGAGVDKLICIGTAIHELAALMTEIECTVFSDVDELIRMGAIADFHDEVILLKGARRFGFERIARLLRLRSHSAVLHVDLGALDHNLRYYYQKIKPGVKKIAVVKANAYGAGSLEVCRFLSYQHIDMLAVAVIDEGIQLRDAGITLPVIVLNPDPEGMDLILQHHLEPEIYNIHILQKLLTQCQFRQEAAVIHVKLDSGTHRLGFNTDTIPELIQMLSGQPWIKVGSIFSHLSGSDEAKWDDFTHEQVKRFDQMDEQITAALGYNPERHILSSTGILRFPQYQYEAVRLGIGLYGVGIAGHEQLLPVQSLKARILHIHEIQPGESVSYSRSFITDKVRTIATVNIGYADGLPRIAGNVGGQFMLHGKLAPITGRVCMDMTMIDVTEIPEAAIGDEVVIFSKEHSIEILAKACNTIPYEIMTHLNPRIRKVYEH